MPLKEAVNDVLRYLGIESSASFADVQELGLFRMLFGRAPLNHVGRGIGHILPVIVAGLLSDPLLGQTLDPDTTLSDYLERCAYSPIVALEELESHLHPKAQTRLAHVLVALARSGRQLIVETHSDHLVRRLRGLVARAEPGSETEKWLLENINIVEVEQTPEGVTYIHQAQLTREGSIEQWPADFMDESSDEERAIYFAAMQKTPPEAPPADESFFTDVPANGQDCCWPSSIPTCSTSTTRVASSPSATTRSPTWCGCSRGNGLSSRTSPHTGNLSSLISCGASQSGCEGILDTKLSSIG